MLSTPATISFQEIYAQAFTFPMFLEGTRPVNIFVPLRMLSPLCEMSPFSLVAQQTLVQPSEPGTNVISFEKVGTKSSVY